MKIFLSHPMTGKNRQEILKLRSEMLEWAYEHYGPDLELIDSYLDLGDIVLVHPDWIFSRGCKLEVDAALMYRKKHVIFM